MRIIVINLELLRKIVRWPGMPLRQSIWWQWL